MTVSWVLFLFQLHFISLWLIEYLNVLRLSAWAMLRHINTELLQSNFIQIIKMKLKKH